MSVTDTCIAVGCTSAGFCWVTAGSPRRDVDIVLFKPHGGRSQAEGDALLSLVTQGSLQAAIFPSDDLDTTFEKVRASGAEVLQEPASQPWGRATAPSVTRGQPRQDRPSLTVVPTRTASTLAQHASRRFGAVTASVLGCCRGARLGRSSSGHRRTPRRRRALEREIP